MRTNNIANDRVLPRVMEVVETSAENINVEIVSIVLYGSRVSGQRNSQNEYELLVLVDNDIPLGSFIRLNNIIRLELLKKKILKVKIQVYTPDTFEEILYNDQMVGTFLYMVCRDNVLLFDKNNVFAALLSRLTNGKVKNETKFLEQCIDFARELGSEKWERRWEKALLQYRYQMKRKNEKY